MINRLRGQVEGVLWALLILLLPLTSLPLLSKLAGGTMVAPAAVIPLVVFAFIFLVPYILRRGRFPRHILPVLGLTLAAIFSTALSFFIDIPLFRDIDRLTNSVSALITLAIGIGFYLLASAWTDSAEKLARIYFWINLSGLIIILWSALQAGVWYSNQAYPEWMMKVQSLFSSNGSLYDRRVTGLAFEPSWLGHQLVLLYLPYWLAATVRRTSTHPLRVWGLTVENGLLLFGATVLLLAFSRSAIISFLLMITLLFLRLTAQVVKLIQAKFHQHKSNSGRPSKSINLARAAIWGGVILIYAGMLAGVLFALTRLDPRMADLFGLLKQRMNFTELANNLIFGERVVYWNAGLEVFSDHPFFGVGLANAGFFFPEKITPFGWTVVESFKMYYSSALPNTLSLWVRLLAETGILGFGIMVSWLVILWKSARVVQTHPDPIINTAGLAGQLALVALLMEGMSVDTFAFPYFWLSFGWLTAAVTVARRTNHSGAGD